MSQSQDLFGFRGTFEIPASRKSGILDPASDIGDFLKHFNLNVDYRLVLTLDNSYIIDIDPLPHITDTQLNEGIMSGKIIQYDYADTTDVRVPICVDGVYVSSGCWEETENEH